MDLEDMMDAEVLRRMVELMYVKHESRQADPTLKRLSGDFIQHIEEHFTPVERPAPLLERYLDLAILPLLRKKFQPSTRRTTLNSSMHRICNISFFYLKGATRRLSHLFLRLTRTLNYSSRRIPFYNREISSGLLANLLEELEFFRDR